MTLVSATEVDASRELSRVVFGQALRIAVTLAVARHPTGVFSLTDIVEAVGVRNASSVQVPLKSLSEAGLILRVPPTSGGERTKWYSRSDATSMWALAEELMAQARTIRSTGAAVH